MDKKPSPSMSARWKRRPATPLRGGPGNWAQARACAKSSGETRPSPSASKARKASNGLWKACRRKPSTSSSVNSRGPWRRRSSIAPWRRPTAPLLPRAPGTGVLVCLAECPTTRAPGCVADRIVDCPADCAVDRTASCGDDSVADSARVRASRRRLGFDFNRHDRDRPRTSGAFSVTGNDGPTLRPSTLLLLLDPTRPPTSFMRDWRCDAYSSPHWRPPASLVSCMLFPSLAWECSAWSCEGNSVLGPSAPASPRCPGCMAAALLSQRGAKSSATTALPRSPSSMAHSSEVRSPSAKASFRKASFRCQAMRIVIHTCEASSLSCGMSRAVTPVSMP
mmetsp:Transcript_45969/g.127614  ORF Transcript_45969/g.127614 Transcript_45969/m.127614 type:complete len:336 (+) Transcript_45969:393-1400(+)